MADPGAGGIFVALLVVFLVLIAAECWRRGGR